DDELMTIGVGNVERVGLFVHRESGAHREMQAAPVFEEFSGLGVPYRDARIVGVMVENDKPAFGIHRDPMDCIELAGPAAFHAPDDLDEFSIFVELNNAMVLVAVGD